jgi:hypothetical protein
MTARVLLLIFAAFAIGAQPPDDSIDADGHLKAEHQIPAGHSCMSRRVFEENEHRLAARGTPRSSAVHPCDCTYTCHVDASGNLMETGGEKSTGCKSYCSKDGRRCACHVEEPCPPAQGQARIDMNGTIVAVGRRSPNAEVIR